MLRKDVYAAIDAERAYQQQRWGPGGAGLQGFPPNMAMFEAEGGPELANSVAAFVRYMEDYMRKAARLAAASGGDQLALAEIRKVVALGVACFEQHGCPAREAKKP